MHQIVELTCTFPLRTVSTKDVVVEQVIDFLFDAPMMPKLQLLILDIGGATWNRVKEHKRGDRLLTPHFEALAASFDQRGVDL
jgi:hypothetical protein